MVLLVRMGVLAINLLFLPLGCVPKSCCSFPEMQDVGVLKDIFKAFPHYTHISHCLFLVVIVQS